MHERSRLTRYAWLSIATAFVTIGLKASAYVLTGSVGLLSDALESTVNLLAAVLALVTLTIVVPALFTVSEPDCTLATWAAPADFAARVQTNTSSEMQQRTLAALMETSPSRANGDC